MKEKKTGQGIEGIEGIIIKHKDVLGEKRRVRRGRRREMRGKKKEKITFDGGGRRRIPRGVDTLSPQAECAFFCGIGGTLLASKRPAQERYRRGRFTGKPLYLRGLVLFHYGVLCKIVFILLNLMV